MRKFIALGLGLATTGMLAVGPASPAHAVISPPASVVTQVCNGLPAQLLSAVNAVTSSGLALTAAQTSLATKTTQFGTSQTNLVAALVSYIQAVDAGGSVDAQAGILGARLSEYTDKAVSWSNAWNSANAANLTATINGMNQSVLNALSAGLGCVAV